MWRRADESWWRSEKARKVLEERMEKSSSFFVMCGKISGILYDFGGKRDEIDRGM